MFSQLFPETNFVTYPNGTSNAPDIKRIVDILRRVKFVDTFGSFKKYKSYYVKTGETPDIVATKLYGSSDWYWLLMVFNDMTDPFNDWPRDGLDFNDDNISYNLDVINYLPHDGSTETPEVATILYPFLPGDILTKCDQTGNIPDTNSTYSVSSTRGPLLAIDINILDSLGPRLQEGDFFTTIIDNGTIGPVYEVKLVRNPITTISSFETQDARQLSPFVDSDTIDTADENILDPTLGGENLTNTLVYKYINDPTNTNYSQYARSVKYSQANKTEQNRLIKVFPDNLKQQAYNEIAKLLSQLPSSGTTSRLSTINKANPNSLSLL